MIVAYPRISNLDEFAPLRRISGASLSWARHAQTIASADVLILPGSKHVAEDIRWLRQTGLDTAIGRHVQANKPTLAICGGLQLMGHRISDPHDVEGAAEGLGLLQLVTEFQASKRYDRATHTFGALSGFWSCLSGISFDAYEIRHGSTCDSPEAAGIRTLKPVLRNGGGWQQGEVLALYTHGLFENAEVLRALFGQDVPTLDDTLEGLANFIEEHIGSRILTSLLK